MEVHQQDTLVNDEDLLVAVCLGLPARYPRAPCRSHLVAAQRPASPARLVRAQDLALSPVVAFVWKAQTLGLAFLEGSALRYAQIADPAPEFIQLQSLKHTLKPETIVAPASCDHAWMTALGSSPLLQQCAAPASGEGDEDNVVAAAVAQPAGEGSTIVRTKSRDWNAEAAYKRMALLRGLEGLSGRNLSDIEVMLHLEHIVPRELEQARRAIGGLLAHMASDETGGLMRITSIEKHKLDAQLYIAPETFLSLNIFADDRHPSAHGGRAKEGAQACASECYSPAGQAAPHTRACVHTTHTTARCATYHTLGHTIPWGRLLRLDRAQQDPLEAGRAAAPGLVRAADAGSRGPEGAPRCARVPASAGEHSAAAAAARAGGQAQGREPARGLDRSRRPPPRRLHRGDVDLDSRGQGQGDPSEQRDSDQPALRAPRPRGLP
jgi:hypothetical protein